MRYIITPSDRFSPLVNPDRAFPVGGMMSDPPNVPPGLYILARNSDTAATGGSASFFWLAIDEGQAPVPPAGVPLNQKFIGQPASFAETNTAGDHQVFPNIFNPPNQAGESVANLLETTLPYSFVGTILGTTISTFGTGLGPPPMNLTFLVAQTDNNGGGHVRAALMTSNPPNSGWSTLSEIGWGMNPVDCFAAGQLQNGAGQVFASSGDDIWTSWAVATTSFTWQLNNFVAFPTPAFFYFPGGG